jgi:ABC-type sulfate/molybdate transport systems ATPase subunit
VLFATHDPTEAKELATGAAVLRDGRLGNIMPPASLDAAQLARLFHERPW